MIAAFQSSPALPLALTLTDFDVDDAVATQLGELDVSGLFGGPVDQVEISLFSSGGSSTASASISVYNNGALVGSAALPQSASLAGTLIASAGSQVFLPEPGMAGFLVGAAAISLLHRRRHTRSAAR